MGVRMKIVINKCWGGFGLSEQALTMYNDLTNSTAEYYWDIERDDPILVQVVEELGNEANGAFAELEIVDIPDGVNWHINEYDGMESIHEDHRSW